MPPRHHPLRLTLLAALLVALGACSSKSDRIDSGLRKGAEFVKLADWEKASVEARNVLQIDPKNAQAYLVTAQVAEGQRDIQRAYGSYLKAVELDPSLLEAKVGLARIFLLAGEALKAQAAIDEVLKLDPDSIGGRTLQAAMTARSGDIKKATEQARAVIASAKTVPVETSTLLAGLYANQGDTIRALEVVEAALKVEPKNVSLIQVAAQLASEDKASPAVAGRAPEFFRRAAEQTPKNTDLWNVWAGYHLRRNEPDLAEKVLREAVQVQPDDGKRMLTLLEFVAGRRGYADAQKEYLAAIDKRPKDAELRFALANLHRSANRPAEAQKVLQQIIDVAPEAPSALGARNQLAAYRLAAGQNDKARALIAEVLKASPRDGTALVLRGRVLLREGKPTDAIADLRTAARDQPGSVEVVGLLAQAHMLAGEKLLAREAIVDAVKFKPDSADLRLLLAAHMTDAKEFRQAQSEIDTALKSSPNIPRLYEVKAQLQFAQKDVTGAEKTLQALKEQLPKVPIGYLRLGQFYAEQKRFDAALKEYDAGSALMPTEPVLYLAAIGLLTGQQKVAEVSARIDALAKADPRNSLPHQVRGDVAMFRKDWAAAESAYRKMIELAPTATQGYQSLARTMVARNDLTGALAALQQGEAAIPKDLTLIGTRAEFLARAGRNDDAIKIYEELLARAPDDEAANNNLAYLLVETRGDPASLQRAKQLTSRFAESSNPSYLDSLGWVHYKLGDYAKAVAVLERAVALQPQSPLLSTHLGMALVKSGETQRGQDILKRVIETKANVPNIEAVRKMAGLG